MNKKLVSALLVSSVLTVACKENSTTTSAPVVDKADAVASVNGVYISKDHLESIKAEVAQNPRGPQFTDEQLIDRLIQSELLVQEAEKQKLQEDADFITRLQLMRNAILSQAAVQAYIDANPPSEEELKAEYDKQFGSMDGEEYKARHILLKSEDDAKAVIVELDKGGDFIALAKEKSTGPSGPNGGDLGWFESKRMVAPFSEAVIALENGKYTKAPVKTQFGWHVILREDSRAKTPPPFEQVKDHFMPKLRNEKITAYLDELRNNAQVEILLAEEKAPAEPAEAVSETVIEAIPDSKPDTAPEQQPAEQTAATETSEK